MNNQCESGKCEHAKVLAAYMDRNLMLEQALQYAIDWIERGNVLGNRAPVELLKHALRLSEG